MITKPLGGNVTGLLFGLIGKGESAGGANAVFNMLKGAAYGFGDVSPNTLPGTDSLLEQGLSRAKISSANKTTIFSANWPASPAAKSAL